MGDSGEGQIAPIVNKVFHALLQRRIGERLTSVALQMWSEQRPLVLPSEIPGFCSFDGPHSLWFWLFSADWHRTGHVQSQAAGRCFTSQEDVSSKTFSRF